MVENSVTTMRLGFHSPSSVCIWPPRTRNLPPYFSTVPGTCFRYSSNPAGSVTSLSTMKYAGMRGPPRRYSCVLPSGERHVGEIWRGRCAPPQHEWPLRSQAEPTFEETSHRPLLLGRDPTELDVGADGNV